MTKMKYLDNDGVNAICDVLDAIRSEYNSDLFMLDADINYLDSNMQSHVFYSRGRRFTNARQLPAEITGFELVIGNQNSNIVVDNRGYADVNNVNLSIGSTKQLAELQQALPNAFEALPDA